MEILLTNHCWTRSLQWDYWTREATERCPCPIHTGCLHSKCAGLIRHLVECAPALLAILHASCDNVFSTHTPNSPSHTTHTLHTTHTHTPREGTRPILTRQMRGYVSHNGITVPIPYQALVSLPLSFLLQQARTKHNLFSSRTQRPLPRQVPPSCKHLIRQTGT